MKKGIYNILKGKFLIDQDAAKNWRFIVFCAVLALIMIAGSHATDRKVHKIAKLQKEVRRLRSEFIAQRENLMELTMESTLNKRLKEKGISTSNTPPVKIVVEDLDD